MSNECVLRSFSATIGQKQRHLRVFCTFLAKAILITKRGGVGVAPRVSENALNMFFFYKSCQKCRDCSESVFLYVVGDLNVENAIRKHE